MTKRLMNIAAKNVGQGHVMPPLFVTTEIDWWRWTMSMTMAKMTMPTISKKTPVLLMIDDELHARRC